MVGISSYRFKKLQNSTQDEWVNVQFLNNKDSHAPLQLYIPIDKLNPVTYRYSKSLQSPIQFPSKHLDS